MNDQELKDKDPLLKKWKEKEGLPIKEIIRLSDNYAIFINNNDEIDWKYNDLPTKNFDEKQLNKILYDLAYYNSYCLHIENDKIKKTFYTLLGEAYASVFSNDYENALKGCERAEKYIIRKNNDITRTWGLITVGLSLFIFLPISYLLLSFTNTQIPHMIGYSLCGSIGVFVSIFFNLNKSYITVDNGRKRIILEYLFRLCIGCIISFITLLLIEIGFLLPQVKQSNSSLSYLVCSILVAISEKYFPSVLEKVEKEILK